MIRESIEGRLSREKFVEHPVTLKLKAEPSLRDDLHFLAGVKRVALVEAVEDQEPLQRAVDQRHAAGDALGGVSWRDRDDAQA